jgi:tetratricopeptide (TPR) repeat protein
MTWIVLYFGMALVPALCRAQTAGSSDIQALQRMLAAGDRGGARQLSEQLLSRFEEEPQALLTLGQLLGSHQEFSLAERAFSRAAALLADSFQAQFNLGLTLYQEHKMEQAAGPLARAAELQPQSFEVNYLLGVVLSQARSKADAIRRLRVARELRPHHASVLAILGLLYVEEGYSIDAIEALEESVKLEPSNVNLSLLLVRAYHENFEFDKALATARSAASRFRDSAEAQFRLGYELETAGLFDEAQQAFERVLTVRSAYAEAHLALGRLQVKNGLYQDAKKHLDEALRSAPNNPEARLEMAKAMVATKELARAQQILLTLTDERPQDPAPHALLAQVYNAKGQQDLSAKETQRYLALSGRSANAGGMGGNSFSRKGQRFIP